MANIALNIAQRVGGPVVTTLLAEVVSLTMRDHRNAGPQQFLLVFVMLTCFHLLEFGAAPLLPLRIHRKTRDKR